MVVNRPGLGIKGEGTWRCTRILHPLIIPHARPATGTTPASEPFYTLKRAYFRWSSLKKKGFFHKCVISIILDRSVHISGHDTLTLLSKTCDVLKKKKKFMLNDVVLIPFTGLSTENAFDPTLSHVKAYFLLQNSCLLPPRFLEEP